MLWLLGGLALCLAGQLVFHLKLGLLDGLVLYAAGAGAVWRSQRGGQDTEQALPLAPGLLAAPPASRTAKWLAMAAALASALAVVLILAPDLRLFPAQLLVMGAAALWVWAGHTADARPFAGPSISDFTVSGRHRLGLLAVLVVALAARVWDLDRFPEGLWYDEARIGSEAWRILTDAPFRPVYSEGTTTPAAYIYLVSWLEAIFGKSVFAIRMASALAGVVSTGLAYAVARLAFGYRVALIAAALFAVARWDINFSRIAMQGATTPMLTLLVVAAALGALHTGRRSLYALLGVSLGALVWFYTSNVFMAGVMVVALASLAVTQPKRLWHHRGGLLLAVAGALLIAAPVAVSTLTSPAEVLNRPQQASVFSTTPPGLLLPAIWDSAMKHAGMLQIAGDRNGRHNLPGAPMLDVVTAVFMIVGLVVAAARWRQPQFALVLAWLPFMLLPGILSVAFEAPQGLRAIGAVAPAMLLAAIGLAAATSRLQPETGNLAAVVLVFLAGASNLSTYFGPQRQDPRVWEDFSMGATILAQKVLAAEDRDRVYGSVHYAAHPTVEFMTGKPANRLEPEMHLPIRDDRGATFVFAEEEPVYYALAAAYYPDAGCQPVTRPPAPQAVAFTCTVSAETVAATRGLPVTVTPESASSGGGPREFIATSGTITLPAGAPSWQLSAVGSLLAPKGGDYRLWLDGPEEMRLLLNGRPLVSGGAIANTSLAQGLHQIELAGRASGQDVRLLWSGPGQANFEPIPQEALYRGAIRPMGLTVDYRNGENYAPAPALRRTEPSPYVYYHVPPIDRPFTAEWTGSLIAPVTGSYRFLAAALSSAEVEIDGAPLVSVGGRLEPEAAVQLTEGLHRIRIRHLVAGSYAHLYLQWRLPGRPSFERIPPERLRPW